MRLAQATLAALFTALFCACAMPAVQPNPPAVAAVAPQQVLCYLPQTYDWSADNITGNVAVNPHCAEGYAPSFLKLVEPGVVTALPRCCPLAPSAAPHMHPLITPAPPQASSPVTPTPSATSNATPATTADVPKLKEKIK